MTTYIDYHAVRPMLAEAVAFGHDVIVPFWHDGDVLGWVPGKVIEIHEPSDRFNLPEHRFIVWIGPGRDDYTLYYPYSVECGVCHGEPSVPCRQCRPVGSGAVQG